MISISGRERAAHVVRAVKDDVVHAEVQLVQKASMEEVTELRLLVQQTTLSQKALQHRARERGICDGSRVIGVEVRRVFLQTADSVPVAPPQVVLHRS